MGDLATKRMLVVLLLLCYGVANGAYTPQSAETQEGYCAVIRFACRVIDKKPEPTVKAAFIDVVVKVRDGGLTPDKVKWHSQYLTNTHPTQAGMTALAGTTVISKRVPVDRITAAISHVAPLVELCHVHSPGVQLNIMRETATDDPGRGEVITLPRSK